MADIRDIDLLVINKKDPDDRGRSWKLRVVQWVVDGSAKSVKLEKRNFYVDKAKSGETRLGKADGLSLEDIGALKPHWLTIINLMRNPPRVEAATGEDLQNPLEQENF